VNKKNTTIFVLLLINLFSLFSDPINIDNNDKITDQERGNGLIITGQTQPFNTITAGINDPAKTVTWEVNNLTTWADAHYGITNGGDNKIHIITFSDNVAIPPTAVFADTFGSVKDITVLIQGTGIIRTSNIGSMLNIGNKQTVIVKDVTLQGRDNNVSLIDVSIGGTFRMEGNAKITGNKAHSNNTNILAGGVRITGGTFVMQDESEVSGNTISTNMTNGEAWGGGIFLRSGSFIMKDNAKVEGNTAIINSSVKQASGGGVYVNGGTFIMENGSISNNIVNGGRYGNASGGGVYVNDGTFVMHNGIISKNIVKGNQTAKGGGVCSIIIENFTIHNGIISDNTLNADGNGIVYAYGGGVYGNLTMFGGTISGNKVIAEKTRGNNNDVFAYGGGVYGKIIMNDGIISGNTVSANNYINTDRASANGGGVYTFSFTKTGGTIYGNNTADNLGNIAVGGRGHAIYLNSFSTGDNWRNAATRPNDNSNRLDFWLNEKDITYNVVPDSSKTSLIFTFSDDPGNFLTSHITLCENILTENAVLTGSGITRTLSPVVIFGDGIITVSIFSIYKVDTSQRKIRITPDAPTNINTISSASTVTLKWNPVYLATGYKIYRSINNSGTYTQIGTTSAILYTDIRLNKNTTYFYKITAFNSAGENITPAQISTITKMDNTRQAITVSSDTIVVEWSREDASIIARNILNSALNILSNISGFSGGLSIKTSYVIYRNGIIIREIEIPTTISMTVVPPFFTFVQDSSLLNHYYVDTGLNSNIVYNYRVVVKLTAELGILELFDKEEDTVMSASATTF